MQTLLHILDIDVFCVHSYSLFEVPSVLVIDVELMCNFKRYGGGGSVYLLEIVACLQSKAKINEIHGERKVHITKYRICILYCREKKLI